MRKRITILFILFLIITQTTNAENPCMTMFPSRDTTSWGIGYIKIPLRKGIKGATSITNSVCYVYNHEIKFYQDSLIKIDHSDVVWVAGATLLKVYQIENTRYRICSHTFKESVWVEFSEFMKHDMTFNTYLSLFSINRNFPLADFKKSHSAVNVGVNLLESCLYLRKEPNLDGEIIKCIYGNSHRSRKHSHIDILYPSGEWLCVKVRFYDYDEENEYSAEGCSFKVTYEYYGYIKPMDDNGRPNIWYTSSG